VRWIRASEEGGGVGGGKEGRAGGGPLMSVANFADWRDKVPGQSCRP